jgi:cellulose biosynthesis protein BcsQ
MFPPPRTFRMKQLDLIAMNALAGGGSQERQRSGGAFEHLKLQAFDVDLYHIDPRHGERLDAGSRNLDQMRRRIIDRLSDELRRLPMRARTKFDWIICNSPVGIERGATLAMRYADAAIIVTNSEVSSVRDSDRIIGSSKR